MPDLEPITRDEMLWSGEDVEPITRREMYIRHLYDETQVIPDKPITREEMFILKAGEELHDVTIEQLNVSENGTYSESGKAYSPVIVDVPLPENAYLLKDFENVPSDIATFSDGANLPMPNLKVSIEPIQSGSGDPYPAGGGKNKFDISKVVSNAEVVNNGTTLSLTTNSQTNNCTAGTPNKLKDYCPTLKEGDTVTFSFKSTGDRKYIYLLGYNDQWNSGTSKTITASMLNSTVLWYTSQGVSTATVSEIQFELGQTATSYAPYSNIRPISGWTEAVVTVADDVDNPTVTHTTTIPFTDSQGNPIEVFGGTCDVVNGGENPSTLKKIVLNGSESWDIYIASGVNQLYTSVSDAISSATEVKTMCDRYKPISINNRANNYNTCYSGNGSICFNIENISVAEWKALLQANNVTVVYESSTPSTFYTQPTSIKSLEGVNNVWGDCGQILEGSYFSESEEE